MNSQSTDLLDVAAQRRWDSWEGRYIHSSHRNDVQARIVAILVFAILAAILLTQLLASSHLA